MAKSIFEKVQMHWECWQVFFADFEKHSFNILWPTIKSQMVGDSELMQSEHNFWLFAFGAYFEQIGNAWFNVRRRDGGVNLCRDSRSFQSNMYHGMKFRRTTVHIRVQSRSEFYISLTKIINRANENWTQVNSKFWNLWCLCW